MRLTKGAAENTKPVARIQKYQQKDNSSKLNTKTEAKNAQAVAKKCEHCSEKMKSQQQKLSKLAAKKRSER